MMNVGHDDECNYYNVLSQTPNKLHVHKMR